MAKEQRARGLPASFQLKVTSEDLLGKPASLPDYLDFDPVRELQKQQAAEVKRAEAAQMRGVQTAAVGNPPAIHTAPQSLQTVEARQTDPSTGFQRDVAAFQRPAELNTRAFQQSADNLSESASPQGVEKQSRKLAPKRLQANITSDTERKVRELMELLRRQAPERDFQISDLMQALIFNLYEARADINVSRIGPRGRWGSPTARAFPVALAEALRDATQTHHANSTRGTFKKAV